MKDELRRFRCCFTGHRPGSLKRPEDDIKIDLENSILRAVSDGFTTFISGLSTGTEIWAAEIVIRMKSGNPNLHLIAVVPFPGVDTLWEESWQNRYRLLLSQAEYVRVMEPAYSAEAYQKRNEWMIAHSARVIAVYNGQPSGTGRAIEYARRCRVPVLIMPG